MGLIDKPTRDLEYKPVGTFKEVDPNTKIPLKPVGGSGLMGKVGKSITNNGGSGSATFGSGGSGGTVGPDGGSIFAGLHCPYVPMYTSVTSSLIDNQHSVEHLVKTTVNNIEETVNDITTDLAKVKAKYPVRYILPTKV